MKKRNFHLIAVIAGLLWGLIGATGAEGAVRLQLAMVIDGSGSISSSDWQIIVRGLADAITNPYCMPQDGSVELTVVQFGSAIAVPEIPPTVITSSNVLSVAALIRVIPQIGGSTPMSIGIHEAAYVMSQSANFNPAIKQAINLVTDGDPNVCDPSFSCPILDPDCYRINTQEARAYAVSLLQMTEGQDEFDVEGIAITDSNRDWLRDYIVYPQPGYIAPPFDQGTGWIRVVESASEFAATLCEKLEAVMPIATPTPSPVPSATDVPAVTTPTPISQTTPTPVAQITATPAPTPQSIPTPSFSNWYLPAGGTLIEGIEFEEYISVLNPSLESTNISVTLVDENGPIHSYVKSIDPQTRYTVKVNSLPGCAANDSISALIHETSEKIIMAERSMYWNPGGVHWGGGHNSIGHSLASDKQYLPEGATHIFDEFVHVVNPGLLSGSDVLVTFMNEAGTTWTVQTRVGPRSNWTIHANDLVGSQGQISTTVESLNGVPIAADRTMYWDKEGIKWIDGHCSKATHEAATSWYLSEGATHIFDEYILVINPSLAATADIRATFMDKAGNTTEHEHPVAPHTRYTIKVNNILGSVDQVSTFVQSLNGVPIMCERAMYWSAGGVPWAGGHDSLGATGAAKLWYLPEGATHIFDSYVLLANPSSTATAAATVTFLDQYGSFTQTTAAIAPHSRCTIKVNNVVAASQLSTKVESDIPVIAERAMYWDAGGVHWASGHETLGIAAE